MFRHPHEITSGRTSSISVDLLRFKTDGPIHGIIQEMGPILATKTKQIYMKKHV